MNKFDFIIVGAGFAGATCARLLTNKNYKCLILEQRPFVSGNCVTEIRDNIVIHHFGAHIIHTNDYEVWEFLNDFGRINPVRIQPKIFNNGQIYSYPHSLQTLHEIYDDIWPNDLLLSLENDLVKFNKITNVKEYCLANYGKSLYELIYKNYYLKLFETESNNLDLDNLIQSYSKIETYQKFLYDDEYQGIPEQGYTKLVENIIGDDIPIMLNTDFLANKEKWLNLADNIIYTGELDRFFNYCIGALDWRSAYFDLDDMSEKTSNVSGTPITIFTDEGTKWYQTTEHKWLNPNRESESTYISYEYSIPWQIGTETCWPILNEKSKNLYSRYSKKLAEQYPNVLLCGRKPEYNFASIAEVVRSAFDLCNVFEFKEQ